MLHHDLSHLQTHSAQSVVLYFDLDALPLLNILYAPAQVPRSHLRSETESCTICEKHSPHPTTSTLHTCDWLHSSCGCKRLTRTAQETSWPPLQSFTLTLTPVFISREHLKNTPDDAVVSAVTSQKQGCGFDSVGWCLCVAFACSPCTWMSTLYSAAVVVREFMKGLELKLTDCSLHTKLCLVHTMHRNDRRFYTAAGSQQAGGKKGGIQGEVDAAGRYVHRWGCENTFSRNSFQHWVHRRQRRAKIFIFHLNISPSLPSLRRRHSVWFRDMKQAVETAFRWSWSMSAGLTCRRLSVPHVVLSETEPDTPVSFHFYFLFVMNHKRERGSQQIRDTSYQI